MHLKSVLAAVVFSFFGLSACTPPSPFPPPAPTPGDEWTMTLTQTGGFAGVHLFVQVSSQGQITATDQRTGRTVTKPLSEATIRQLTGLLQESALSEAGRLPSVCADCFIYDLEISSSAGNIHIQADDTTLEESGAGPLIEYLGQIRDRELRSAS